MTECNPLIFPIYSIKPKRLTIPVRPQSWLPGLNLIWARPNLGSQLTCMVGLSFLLRVILGRDSMRSLFSLSPLNFFPLFF